MATDWLRYANQGATRRLPLNERLVQALAFLPELGVSMEVFSGGQPGKGSGQPRVGSTRHDHGNAADVFFHKNGRRLDWANQNDRPIFDEIVRRGKAAGITGFGAGPGYMQPGSMHIGFGSPGVWGAGGKGGSAPDWLRAAYAGGSSPAAAASLSGAAHSVATPAGRPVLGSMGIPAPASSGVSPTADVGQHTGIPPSSSAIPPLKQNGGMPDIFGMMAAMDTQGPQFSDGRVAGPSPEQALGLGQLVEALKKRMVI